MKRASENDIEKGKKFKSAEITQDLGIILSVSLKNFMCHDHLKFDFDPHINFIIGENGSGKSAVMSGIILALGGKSNLTGRYKNVQGFIKNGKNSASLSVTLKNCGPRAYKPEKYGNKIIVEREIKKDTNNSSYKLKNENGHVESTLTRELSNILLAMDIQIDNPVLVLTQDTSRSFLMAKTGKEESLYEFFYKGTGLKKLEEDYKNSVSTNDACAKDLEAKKQALDIMEKEVKKLEKLRESDEKLDELKREAFWARVIVLEKQLEAKQVEKRKLLKAIEITKNEAEKSKNKLDEVTILLQEFQKERADIEKEILAERKSLSELGNQSEMYAGNVRNSKGLVDRYTREEKKLLADIRELETAINEHQMKDQTDYENEKRQRNEEILKLEKEILNAEHQKADVDENQMKILDKRASKANELKSLRQDISDLNSKRSNKLKEHSQMVNSKKNRQYLFGEHTPAVLREIQQNQRNFRNMPRGPIGLDIEVKDTMWTGAVEACIKPHMLRSFCVDNPDDSMLMTQILQKYYTDRMPSVIVSPFLSHVHNVSQHKAQTNFPTVLDMLTIKDPVIANCLIDQLSIENIILIEDITTAQKIMLDRPPAKCYSAFLMNCDEILLNPYRFYSASRKPTNLLSHTVDDNDLLEIQNRIEILDAEIRKKESAMTDIRLEIQNYNDTLEELANQIVQLTTSKSDAAGRIEELKQFEEPKNVPEMYDEYESLKADLEKKQEELREAQNNLTMNSNKCQEIRQKLSQQRATVQSLNQKFESLGSDINSCVKNKEALASAKKEFEQSKKENERNLNKLEKDIEEIDNGIKKTIDHRQKVDKKPRIRTTRAHEDIDAQIGEITKVISEQSNTSDKASLLELYAEKSKRLNKAKNEYKQIERNHKQIAKMMAKREQRTRDIIRYTQLVLDFSFKVFLSANGFDGRLNFSKSGCLILEATPCKGTAKSAGKKACSSLSGGERSFVTIAFLVALWDKIRMPFRILDEYDVFMDSNNRHLSISLLLKQADIMKRTQFIFLSPLDLPNLQNTNNIKVHKMQAPQRIGLSNMDGV